MSDAPLVSFEDNGNTIVYRASALGGCLRALWASRSRFEPKPPPARLQEAFDEGHRLEPIILELLAQTGWSLKDPQATVELELGENSHGQLIIVRGHVDAMGTRDKLERFWMPVDAKAFAQSTFDDFMGNGIMSFPHYSWQQSVYAIACGSDSFCLPIYNKETKVLHTKVFDTIPHTYTEIYNRVMSVEKAFLDGDSSDDLPCTNRWGCPYDYLHDVRESEELNSTQLGLVHTYKQVTAKINEYTEARKKVAQLLLDQLPYNDTLRTFTGSGYTVSVVNNSRRLDTKKVKALLTEAELDLDDYYVPGEGVSVRVSEKKEGQDGKPKADS